MSKLIEGSSSSLMQLFFNNGDGISMSLGESPESQKQKLCRDRFILAALCVVHQAGIIRGIISNTQFLPEWAVGLLQLRGTTHFSGDLQNSPGGPLRKQPMSCHVLAPLCSRSMRSVKVVNEKPFRCYLVLHFLL